MCSFQISMLLIGQTIITLQFSIVNEKLTSVKSDQTVSLGRLSFNVIIGNSFAVNKFKIFSYSYKLGLENYITARYPHAYYYMPNGNASVS